MLKDIEGKHAVKNRIAKREMVRVAYDIGMSKNLMLQFDAIRMMLRRPARANVQDEIISGLQDGFVFRWNWIAAVVRSDQLERFGKKNGDAIVEREGAETALAMERVAFLGKRTAAPWANQDVFYACA
jgi:hypothetical protein